MRGYRVVRTVSVHVILLDPRIFIIQRQGEEKWGRGVGVNGHAYRYVLVLPAKRVFFFPVLSHSETTLHHGVSPLAQANGNLQ